MTERLRSKALRARLMDADEAVRRFVPERGSIAFSCMGGSSLAKEIPEALAHVSNPLVVAPPVRSVSSYRRPASADRARASGISFARDEPPIQEKAIDPRSGTNRRTASSASISRARRAFDRNRSVIPGVSWAAVAPLNADDRVPLSVNA